jgi:phosphoglycerate dehydrogenase-like enzyme
MPKPRPRPSLLVLSPKALFESFFDAPRRARLGRALRWKRIEARTLTPRVRAALGTADALLTTWDSPSFDEGLTALAPRLRLVVHCGGEVKARFARPLFSRLVIANAQGPMATPVAELAVTLLLHHARRLDTYREALRRGSVKVYEDLHDHGTRGETLQGRRVGLLGFGRVGRETARLLRPFATQLQVHDPHVPASTIRRAGAEPVSWGKLLRTSQSLVVAAALTEATKGLLNRQSLRLLPTGAVVVNVARGGLVDLEALAAEVRSGRLECALDVTDPLEPLPARHPLRRMRGAVVTPHLAAATVGVRRAMADTILDNLERFYRGERVRTRVTPAMLDRMT